MANLIFPTGFEEKTTIAQDDVILMADSEDSNKIKKAKYSHLKGEQGDPGQDGQDGQDGTDGTDGASIVSGEFVGNNLVFGKDDGTSVTIENAKTTLQGPEGEEGPEGPEGPEGNGIESVTATKAGKITTVTITETNGTKTTFQVSDGQDGQGAGDVVGPNSSTNEDIVLFDGTDGKHIKGGTKKLSDLVQTSGNQTIGGTKTYTTEPVLPSKTTDATNDGTKPATEAQVYKKQNAISNSNKLDADLVDDTNSTNKFVTASEKATWNGKQNAINNNNKLSADNVSNGTNNRVCIVGATAPSTPSEGDLWYDTTNDKLKSYDGANWNVVGEGDISYIDFETATSTGATVTLSYMTTQTTPTSDFTVTCGTVKEGMQYILRVNSGATAYTMTLGTGITNPFGEDLTLTASKMTTVVLFATSSSALEVFSVRTAS